MEVNLCHLSANALFWNKRRNNTEGELANLRLVHIICVHRPCAGDTGVIF